MLLPTSGLRALAESRYGTPREADRPASVPVTESPPKRSFRTLLESVAAALLPLGELLDRPTSRPA